MTIKRSKENYSWDPSGAMVLQMWQGHASTQTPQNWLILPKGIEYKTPPYLSFRNRNKMAEKTQGQTQISLAKEGVAGPTK